MENMTILLKPPQDLHSVYFIIYLTTIKFKILVEKNSEMKGKMEEYQKFLFGKVEYNSPKENSGKLEGTIKLLKDPKYENFSILNVIPKASILIYTDWLIFFMINY